MSSKGAHLKNHAWDLAHLLPRARVPMAELKRCTRIDTWKASRVYSLTSRFSQARVITRRNKCKRFSREKTPHVVSPDARVTARGR